MSSIHPRRSRPKKTNKAGESSESGSSFDFTRSKLSTCVSASVERIVVSEARFEGRHRSVEVHGAWHCTFVTEALQSWHRAAPVDCRLQ